MPICMARCGFTADGEREEVGAHTAASHVHSVGAQLTRMRNGVRLALD